MTTAEQLEKRGEKRGEERGILKSKIEIAINLLKEDLDMALIVRITNLEPSKIKELAAELNQSQI